MNSFEWERGGGRDVVLNFIRTHNFGGQNGYPKLNLFINEKEKKYLQEKAWNVSLHCEYLVDDEERRSRRDIQIFLSALSDINDYYRKKSIYDE